MRLALTHLRHARTGGTERYLDRLAGHLAARGHEVTILCRSHSAAPHPAVRFELVRGLALGGAWRTWSFARGVARHLERQLARYDLVLGLGRTWTQDVLRLGGGCQRTYLERAHQATLTPRDRLLGSGAWKHALAVRIEERALASPEVHVLTNSEMVKRDVQARYGVPDERLSVIHNGVDLERFHPRARTELGPARRRELGFAPEDRVLLFLGTGYARKGLDLLLEAFVRVRAAHPRARLLVAGFDSARARHEARAAELGLTDVTRFVGGTLAPEHMYAAADLYVLPTRYDPFANSTLEAMAAGLAVVTSTANGGAELIDEGVQGARVELADGCEALTRALLAWCEPERLRAGGRAARARAEQHGDADKFAAAELLFTRLAARRVLRPAPAGSRP